MSNPVSQDARNAALSKLMTIAINPAVPAPVRISAAASILEDGAAVGRSDTPYGNAANIIVGILNNPTTGAEEAILAARALLLLK